MPSKKPGFSLKQHDELGKELQAMHNRFTRISVELSKAYPVKSNITGVVEQSIKSLFKLRSKLANLAIGEHGSIGDSLYFRGGRTD